MRRVWEGDLDQIHLARATKDTLAIKQAVALRDMFDQDVKKTWSTSALGSERLSRRRGD